MAEKSKGIKQYSGIIAPFDMANIDTDAIIPKQFLQKVTRSGFGQHLFHDWRYLDSQGLQINPQFILNLARYQNASILLARENFGCGSSREHALWALGDYGFKLIIAPSFADIFYSNAINNQIAPITLDKQDIDTLFDFVFEHQGAQLSIDLEEKKLNANGIIYPFSFNETDRQRLLQGLDNIALTLKYSDEIAHYEASIPSFLN